VIWPTFPIGQTVATTPSGRFDRGKCQQDIVQSSGLAARLYESESYRPVKGKFRDSRTLSDNAVATTQSFVHNGRSSHAKNVDVLSGLNAITERGARHSLRLRRYLQHSVADAKVSIPRGIRCQRLRDVAADVR